MDNSGVNKFEKIALIDADSLIFFAVHNKKDSTKVKTLDDCKKHIDQLISNICKFTHATHYICTLTVGKNFRFTVNSEYKSNRKALVRPLYFDQVKEHLITKHKAIYNFNLESDDLVNIYKNKSTNSFICACDSDILEGLPGKHFNYKKFEWVITDAKDAKVKFWKNMISGTHNGVKGLKGKGEKYANQLIYDASIYTSDFSGVVLKSYIEHYKSESIGIEEFYKNYKCIRLLDDYEGLQELETIKIDGSIIQEGQQGEDKSM